MQQFIPTLKTILETAKTDANNEDAQSIYFLRRSSRCSAFSIDLFDSSSSCSISSTFAVTSTSSIPSSTNVSVASALANLQKDDHQISDTTTMDRGGRFNSSIADELQSNNNNSNKKNSMTNGIPKQTATFLQACEQCDEDLVRFYIASGVSTEELNAQDKTGKSGLAHACSNGFATIVSLMRLPNINVNLSDNEGNTPLIFAAQAGHGDIVSLLLNYFPGVDIDKANNHGFTALMKAAIQGRARCAKLLLYAGASLYKRDFGRGLCALEWAEYCNRQTCAKTISQFVEACNLGIICSNLLANPRNLLGGGSKNANGNPSKWKSDSSLNSDSMQEINCIPFRILKRVRRSLPANDPPAERHSAIQSLEDVARCLYTPVFPECISSAPATPLGRSPSLGSNRRGNRAGPASIPKVEITFTSKDDNFFYENPPFSSNKGNSQKFKRYTPAAE